MKSIKLYREENGQYSTSEAQQNDISGDYVQQTDYDELQKENDELRARVQCLEVAMITDIHKTGENFRLQSALDESPAQSLADIKADAVFDLVTHPEIFEVEFTDTRVLPVSDIIDYSNKLRGSK